MINKTSAQKITLEMYKNGWKVKVIAKTVERSESTVYAYLQNQYDEVNFPILKDLLKKALLCGDFKRFVESLSYKDLSMIRRKFGLYGWDKATKIKAILDYFKHYSVLGLYPDKLTRDTIKRAFFRKAKEVHPDLNKRETKRGERFQEVYQSYNYLLTIHA